MNSTVRGVIYIHSAPAALCPHIEWALARVLGNPMALAWSPQPAEFGMRRADTTWTGTVGTSAALASALQGWQIRFEVTEDGAGEGSRYCYTPTLGVFHAATGPHGDIVVSEQRLRSAMAASRTHADLTGELDRLLGRAWDDELEPFRYAGDEVRWLQVI